MTGKSLSDRLADQAKKEPQRRGTGRAAFIALKGEIADALVAGWQAKEIHALLKKERKLEISYTVFLRYIKQFITDPSKAGGGTPQVVVAQTAPVQPAPAAAAQRPQAPRNFEFTPKK